MMVDNAKKNKVFGTHLPLQLCCSFAFLSFYYVVASIVTCNLSLFAYTST